MNRTEYLTTLTEQIQNKHAKELIIKEITAHIEDQKEAWLLEGKDDAEAEELAVKEMGSPIDTGMKLNKIHRPKTDKWMLLAMVVLTLTGIIMQSVIGAECGNVNGSSVWVTHSYQIRTILYNLAGFSLMLIVCFADYRLLGKYAWPLYGIYLAAAAFFRNTQLIPAYAQRLMLSNVVCVLFVPLFAALSYHFRGEKGKGIFKAVFLLVFHFLFMLFAGYYLSASLLLSLAACLITLCAAAYKGIFGGRKKLQVSLLLAFIIGIPALFLGDVLLLGGRFLFLAEYQIMRIQAMFHPASYAAGYGYQTMLVRQELAAASLIGGGSIGKIGGLRGAWCDYVLIGLTAYFGLLVSLIVISIIAAYFIRSLHIAFMQSNRLGFLLGMSCSSILILKTLVYVAMNFGVGPAVGIDMPFLTYGLSGTLINFLFMGMILAVYRNTNILPEYGETARYRLRLEKVSDK